MQTLPKPSLYNCIPLLCYQQINKESILIFSSRVLLTAFRVLKTHICLQFKLLSCISGVDLLQDTYRFNVVYEILSIQFNSRLRIKLFTNENVLIPSITLIYINANWWEREVWDLFGLYFENHLDLRRILNDYSFEGYPMRKDFPLSGYGEVGYSFNIKAVTFEKIFFSQELRLFH